MTVAIQTSLQNVVINYSDEGLFLKAFLVTLEQVYDGGVLIGSAAVPTEKTLDEIKAVVAALEADT